MTEEENDDDDEIINLYDNIIDNVTILDSDKVESLKNDVNKARKEIEELRSELNDRNKEVILLLLI